MPVKMIWNPLVPTKMGFFVWEVWWGKIFFFFLSVKSNLYKRKKSTKLPEST